MILTVSMVAISCCSSFKSHAHLWEALLSTSMINGVLQHSKNAIRTPRVFEGFHSSLHKLR
ncbi:hypothetical protein B9P99_03775 [Candidatus Marsarchaeota G1 archaeon OSP_B]|uniref:Uncharacterized protein n=3 Tax=Candidatus Marsarchaeota group 1 TaxID=2203770 RepID=A0A2R6A681_9ARCH|nr:MAG: hypothetical protein B9Q01_09645 [Candidatus Marsarchaeota G1 archaeon OSP_D]PSN82571.1 MAG: hypothetical protein B9Q01_07655 [Candidatus Marsarchaeota G1 archaeon OSP_D]PSN88826.1 MAG: hypothetical protein B9Q00_04000 [Candidatus Marsarchaeota G1 archaeon OSP_C]PSN91877.1 MAG: hypothetical protein B9P99_03775 [Candidatus Marsarchaeota G1 archaeon OSP_B]